MIFYKERYRYQKVSICNDKIKLHFKLIRLVENEKKTKE
jgi:hypothetical protein